MPSPKEVAAAWHVFVRNTPWAQRQDMEHVPVMPKAPHVPEGKTGITPEDDASAGGSHQSILQNTKAVCPGTTLTQSLLCENSTIHLPWLKREGLWSVMLNADKRAIETKGKPNTSAFNTLFRNLEMCCISLWWLQKPFWIFPWNWIKWIWVCSEIAAHSFTDVSTFCDCF